MNDDRPELRPADLADGVVEQPARRAAGRRAAARSSGRGSGGRRARTCRSTRSRRTPRRRGRGSPAGGSRPGRRRRPRPPARRARAAWASLIVMPTDGHVVVAWRRGSPSSPSRTRRRAGGRRDIASSPSLRQMRSCLSACAVVEVGRRRRRSGRTSTSSPARARAGRSRCRRRSGGWIAAASRRAEWRPPCRRASCGGGGSGRPSTPRRRAARIAAGTCPTADRDVLGQAARSAADELEDVAVGVELAGDVRPGQARAGSGSTAAAGRRPVSAAATSRRHVGRAERRAVPELHAHRRRIAQQPTARSVPASRRRTVRPLAVLDVRNRGGRHGRLPSRCPALSLSRRGRCRVADPARPRRSGTSPSRRRARRPPMRSARGRR